MGICGKTVLVSILSLSLDYSTRQSHGPPRITSFLFEIIVIKQRAYCKCAYSKQAQETIMRGHLTQLSERLFREKQRLQFLHRMFWRSNSMSNSLQRFHDHCLPISWQIAKERNQIKRSAIYFPNLTPHLSFPKFIQVSLFASNSAFCSSHLTHLISLITKEMNLLPTFFLSDHFILDMFQGISLIPTVWENVKWDFPSDTVC